MAIGKPDWSNVVEQNQQGGNADIAELTTRLLSWPKYYRTGKVLWLESFENSFSDFVISIGGASTFTDYATITNFGANAKQVFIPLVGGANIQLIKYLPFFASRSFGFSYALKGLAGQGTHSARFLLYRSGTLYDYRILYNGVSQIWQFSGGSQTQNIVTQQLNVHNPGNYYDNVKCVIDTGNDIPKYFLLNGVQYELSPYAPFVSASALPDLIAFVLTFNTLAGGDHTLQLDDICLTYDEPVS